ncbi:hypothetical protein SLEP1_g19122 [Rubroshorea leprosula]|nr:hypothetical protein SLEP1_g19122 [Rubroshorea leprosula]
MDLDALGGEISYFIKDGRTNVEALVNMNKEQGRIPPAPGIDIHDIHASSSDLCSYPTFMTADGLGGCPIIATGAPWYTQVRRHKGWGLPSSLLEL